jgi:hypothetical protein
MFGQKDFQGFEFEACISFVPRHSLVVFAERTSRSFDLF